MKRRGIKKTKGDIVFGILNIRYLVCCIICAFTLLYLIINSVSANGLFKQ